MQTQEIQGDIIVDGERLRFQNGCPDRIKSEVGEKTLHGIVLAVYDISGDCDRKDDEK